MRLNQFCRTAWSRHRIYILKELGTAKPWTEDSIYLDNFFCNVFRYLDKTSKYIIKEAIEPNEDNSELWKTIIVCRYISRLDTLQQLNKCKLLINNQRALYEYLREMQYDREKIFTNAFIVNSKTSNGWKDKVTYLFSLIKDVYELCASMPDRSLQIASTLEELYLTFITLDGVGPFMAYQYAIDFSYSERYLKNATDKYDWTQLGLGAVRGMNRILTGSPGRTKIPEAIRFTKEILAYWKNEVDKHLANEVFKTLQIARKKWNQSYELNEIAVFAMYEPFKDLTMSDVEHWLCEYDKYMRGGSKKRRYYGNI